MGEKMSNRKGTYFEIDRLANKVRKLEKEMKSFAKSMEFEKAALIRDQIQDIRIIIKKVE